MAAPDFSAAIALIQKAIELANLGHWARATAKCGQALDAALTQRCPDCLVVAQLQIDHASAAVNALNMESVSVAEYRARLAAVLTQVLVAAATLQRRKAAGTLLGTTCTAAELQWSEQHVVHLADANKNSTMRRKARQLAPTFGYRTLLLCAIKLVDCVQLSSNKPELSSNKPERLVMTAEQLRACWIFLADAVECMAQPRGCEDMAMSAEGAFVKRFRDLLSSPRCNMPRDELGARLRATWQHLESSGVLQQQRHIDLGIKSYTDTNSVMLKAATAAAADPGLRRCALASCGAREQHASHFKSCAACRIPFYCSKEHQTADWPNHKAACKAARKLKAEA